MNGNISKPRCKWSYLTGRITLCQLTYPAGRTKHIAIQSLSFHISPHPFHIYILHKTSSWTTSFKTESLVCSLKNTIVHIYISHSTGNLSTTHNTACSPQCYTFTYNDITSGTIHFQSILTPPGLHGVTIVLTIERTVFYQYIIT